MLTKLQSLIDALKEHIRKDEGCPKNKDSEIVAYFEEVSEMWHIAYGHLLDTEQSIRELKAMGLDDELDNWEGFIITEEQAEELLNIDIDDALTMLKLSFDESELEKLDTVRFISLFSMSYQLGSVVKFPAMVSAIKREDWDRAADEMLWSCGVKKTKRSQWYKDTPKRCQKMADAMRWGTWEGEPKAIQQKPVENPDREELTNDETFTKVIGEMREGLNELESLYKEKGA